MAQIGSSTAFTTTEAVRGALGVDSTDLKDQQILDADLATELGLELSSWCGGYAAKIAPPTPVTAEQLNLQAALQSYCKWYCALEYARKPLTFVQLYGDGKAEMRRFTNFDWDTLINTCVAKVAHCKAMAILLDPAATTAQTPELSMIAGVTPTYDPVTNVGAV